MSTEKARRARSAALRCGAALVVFTLFVQPLVCQDAETRSFVEKVTVELVNVEVWVTDKDDRLVSGLTADDFVVLHDGKPAVIEYFAEVRSGDVPSATGGSETPSPDAGVTPGSGREAVQSHLVVYFDELNLQHGNRKILVDQLKAFLDSDQVSPERVLVLRQNRGLFIEAPFGSTSTELAEALTRISESGAQGAALASDADQAMEEIRSLWSSSQATAGSAATGIAGVPQGAPITTIPDGGGATAPSGVVGGGGSGGFGGLAPSGCEVFISRVEPLLDNFYRQRSVQVGTTLERLSETVTFLSGLSGVKTLLYLSDRLETAPAAGLASYAAGLCPTEQQNLLMNAQVEDMSQLMTEVARHASANRVTIYGVQGRGLRTRSSGSAGQRGDEFRGAGGFGGAARANQQGGLLVLSEETGGRAVLNTNDFAAAFESIHRDANTFYSIAYRPLPSDQPRFHKIDVRVERDGLRTRHRRGYREKSADELLAERVLGALNLGVTSNPLSLRLGAGAIQPGDGDLFLLPLRIQVPVPSVTFVAGEEGSRGELTVKVNAHDTARGRLINEDRIFRLTLPPGQAGEWVNLSVDLTLAEGVHVLAVGLRDNASGAMSFVSTTVEITDPSG